MSATPRSVRANRRTDPTRTKTLRRRYAQRLRGQLRKLNAAIRRGIVERDSLGLRGNEPAAPTELPVFRFRSDGDKADRFMEWLERSEERGLLEVISRNDNPYVRQSYHRGLDHATTELTRQGLEPEEVDVEEVFNKPIHQEAVRTLYTRNFEELQGITQTMNQQISRELTDGFVQGLNPRTIVRNITDRVDAIGKHRATVMARTEIINAYSEATLNRYERQGVSAVTVRAEIETAGDSKVCQICEALEGRQFTIQEAREETWRFDEDAASHPTDVTSSMIGDKPFKPPIHPQCRCALIPVIN